MSTPRLLDANANRAREGLRTLEDLARFTLDDAPLAAEAREIRHAVTAALPGDLILHRDTPGDVGVTNATPERRSLRAVADAAAGRAGEALRVIEEVGHPAAGPLRYRVYELHRRLALRLDRGGRMADVRLYVLITEAICRRPWREVAEAAVAGGADCLQLREPDLAVGELLARATWLADLCRDAGVISIVNDRPDVAALAGCDGVHVGQGDLPPLAARKIVGDDAIVGVSTHEPAHLAAATEAGADYVGVGPVFPSATKPRDFTPGLAYAREAAAGPLPSVAIAGITRGNIADVAATGVTAAAVTAAVCASDDPEQSTRELRKAFVMKRPVG